MIARHLGLSYVELCSLTSGEIRVLLGYEEGRELAEWVRRHPNPSLARHGR